MTEESADRLRQIATNPDADWQRKWLALDKLAAGKRKATDTELRELIDFGSKVAHDSTEAPAVRQKAIQSLWGCLIVLEERGVFDRLAIESHGERLLLIAAEKSTAELVRGAALRALGELRLTNTLPALRAILTAEPDLWAKPELSRDGMISLLRLDGIKAVPDFSDALRRTPDPTVFGTAAYCLGELGTPAAVAVLVTNASRFPDVGSSSTALNRLSATVLSMLATPEHPQFREAVMAIKLIRFEERAKQLLPLLTDALARASLADQRLVVEQILEEAVTLRPDQRRETLLRVMQVLPASGELQTLKNRVQALAAAEAVPPSAGISIPTPNRD